MKMLSLCLLYTQDANFAERVCGSLHSIVKIQHVGEPDGLERQLRRMGPVVLMLDLQSEQTISLLKNIKKTHPLLPIIALGVSRSDPMLAAEDLGAFCVEDRDIPWRRLQKVVQQAVEHLRLKVENQILSDEQAKLAAGSSRNPRSQPEQGADFRPLRYLHRAFRHFGNLDALLENIVEGVASTAMVSRAGIISWVRSAECYRLRAGLRCLDDTRQIKYDKNDPFVHWLEVNAHLVSRETLEHIKNPVERMLLKQTLDALGAEVIIPLQARTRLLGWLFVGHHAMGIPFDDRNIEDIMIVAEHISTNLENALLYEEVAVQKTLLETLFQSMPTGIIVVGTDGNVQWLNHAARQLLGSLPDEVIGCPVNVLGSRMGDVFLRALKEKKSPKAQEWVDPVSKKTLLVKVYCLLDKDVEMGAVSAIEDLSGEQMLREKQEQLERTAFWSELAAAMSHQIRTPLVAIKTFADLLPSRYDDPAFRNKFGELVPREIDRLNAIVDLLNNYAHPPQLVFKLLDLKTVVQKGVELARAQLNGRKIEVEMTMGAKLPPVNGDGNTLAQCIGHLLVNSAEALKQSEKPQVTVAVESSNGAASGGVLIRVRDNGAGIPAEIRDKIFSPFCTTKTTGMGLGLPIVRRTILDHNGSVNVETDGRGTEVAIFLPSVKNEVEP
ncbi:MAG: ATP-binding protein [Verrucomicrobiae bacterium]|nr:ATP-binding protein [Verrucomicrobiae bacterium]